MRLPPRLRRTAVVNASLAVLALAALLVTVVRGAGPGGVEVMRRDPPPGVDAVRVHVRGAVHAPGVVEVQPGDRFIDAIDRAGGALPDADLHAVNLALRVRDEDVVTVPFREAGGALAGGPAASRALIDINSASAEALESLPGIGPARAADIAAGRPYATTDELLDRGVLSPALYADVRTLITAR